MSRSPPQRDIRHNNAMQSILLISQDKKIANEYIDKLCVSEKIDIWDKDVIRLEKAAGIEEVRILQKKIILKPNKSQTKAIIVKADFGITIDAQNALLKILEEPPSHTIIIIRVDQKDQILPTILSRCKIIRFRQNTKISDEEKSRFSEILNSLLENGVGDKLKIAQDASRDKDNAANFLEKLILVARENLLDNPQDQRHIDLLKALQKTYSVIKTTNVNKRIALENLFLSF